MVPKKTDGGGTVCVVCGDLAFGRHYGASACNGCKGFFRRSVWNKRSYKCRFSDTCTIEKERRNNCRSCRLKKCYMAGLNPRAVQNERDRNARKNDASPGGELPTCYSSTGMQTSCITEETDLPTSLDTRLDQTATALMELEHRVMTRVDYPIMDEPPPPLHSRLNVSFATAFGNPSLVTRRTPLRVTGERIAQLEDSLHDFRRAFVLYADWLGEFADFSLFSKDDQMHLAHHRFGPFYWGLCAHWTVKTGCDGVCYANGAYYPRIPELQCIHDVRGVCELMVRGLADPMRNLNLDDTEFCLMRVIGMFKEDYVYLSAQGRKHANRIRDYYIRVLIRYVRSYHSQMSEHEVGHRVAEIMLLITVLDKLAHLVKDNIRLSEVLNIVDWDLFTCELNKDQPSL